MYAFLHDKLYDSTRQPQKGSMSASIARLRDGQAVPSCGAAVGGTFSDVKKRLSPPLDALVDACVSTLSHPSLEAAPSAIQAECWAVLLGSHPADVVGVSPTGSGKTLAYLLPAFASLLLAPAIGGRDAAPAPAPAAGAGGPAAAEAPASTAATADDVRARAEEAMRETATSALADAIHAGLSKEEAKGVARKKAKAVYRAVIKAGGGGGGGGGAAAALSTDGVAAVQQLAPQSSAPPGTSDAATKLATVPLAPGAVEPRVIVLAPTRELCLQISAVCESIVGRLEPGLRTAVACGCLIGGMDFNRQRQALLGQQPTLLVATPGRLLSQCGHVPASSDARERAARARGEATTSAAAIENLPGRGSLAARRRLAARLVAEGAMEAVAVAPALPAGGGDAPESLVVRSAAIDLAHVAVLVLDEADRLLDLGFEADLHTALALLGTRPSSPDRPPPPGAAAAAATSIAAVPTGPTTGPATDSESADSGGHGSGASVAPPRRTLLFSATFSPRVRALAAGLLQASALRITVERHKSAAAAFAEPSVAHAGDARAATALDGGGGGGGSGGGGIGGGDGGGDGGADPALTSSSSVVQHVELHRGRGGRAVVRRRVLALLHTYLGGSGGDSGAADDADGESEEEEEEEVEEEEEEEEEEADDDGEGADGIGEGGEGEREVVGISEGGEGGEGDEDGAGGAGGVGGAGGEGGEGGEGGAGGAGGEGGEGGEGGVADDDRPRVIVFALYKLEAAQLAQWLVARGLAAVALHGDMNMRARGEALRAFRSGRAQVLVATDVAARGLDVKHVRAVINTSLGMSIENYVHRCGRCGRAGATGVATTFVVDGDEPLVAPLVALLERSRQRVPPELRTHAQRIANEATKGAEAGQGAPDGVADGGEESELAYERRQMRQMQIANREQQLAMHAQKKSRERGGGGKGGGGHSGGRKAR